jgi:hypothetical protein
VAERFADGLASAAELEHVRRAAGEVYVDERWELNDAPAHATAHPGYEAEAGHDYAWLTAGLLLDGLQQDRLDVQAEQRQQLALLRCVFANPFRPLPPRSFPAHVGGLARAIYAAFPVVSEDYAVLADALEELGEAGAAAHCRTELHAKGCHVLDWIAGRG